MCSCYYMYIRLCTVSVKCLLVNYSDTTSSSVFSHHTRIRQEGVRLNPTNPPWIRHCYLMMMKMMMKLPILACAETPDAHFSLPHKNHKLKPICIILRISYHAVYLFPYTYRTFEAQFSDHSLIVNNKQRRE